MVPPNTLKTLISQSLTWRSNFEKNIAGTLGNFVNQFHTWAELVNNLLILGVLGGTGGHFWNLGGTCSVLLGGTSQQKI